MIGQMPYIQVIAGGSPYLLYDTFTDTNGTLLTAHTMDVGGGWTNQIGTFDIQSNRANRASAGSPDNQSVATADAGMADYEVTCTVNGAAGSDGTGIAVRYSASNQRFYFAQIEILNNAFRIYEYNAGYTERASSSTSLTGGTDYDMVVRMEGTTITASIPVLNDANWSTNVPAALAGAAARSLSFDGTDDIVTFSPLTLNTAYTLALWIRYDSAGESEPFGTNQGVTVYGLYVSGPGASGSFYHSIASLNFVTVVHGGLSGWNHVAVTRSASDVIFYKDGVQIGSTQTLPNGSVNFNTLQAIGGSTSVSSYLFTGLIDDVRVYNRALSAEEVATLAAGGNPSSTGLVGHWKFDEGSGNTATDSSGSGNHGTILGREYLTYASASTNASSTLVGLRCGPTNQQRFDDFEVVSL